MNVLLSLILLVPMLHASDNTDPVLVSSFAPVVVANYDNEVRFAVTAASTKNPNALKSSVGMIYQEIAQDGVVATFEKDKDARALGLITWDEISGSKKGSASTLASIWQLSVELAAQQAPVDCRAGVFCMELGAFGGPLKKMTKETIPSLKDGVSILQTIIDNDTLELNPTAIQAFKAAVYCVLKNYNKQHAVDPEAYAKVAALTAVMNGQTQTAKSCSIL